jgi:hypothetical protein
MVAGLHNLTDSKEYKGTSLKVAEQGWKIERRLSLAGHEAALPGVGHKTVPRYTEAEEALQSEQDQSQSQTEPRPIKASEKAQQRLSITSGERCLISEFKLNVIQ